MSKGSIEIDMQVVNNETQPTPTNSPASIAVKLNVRSKGQKLETKEMSVSTTVQTPLLLETVDGAVDYKGRLVLRSSSGGWRSASFIIGSTRTRANSTKSSYL
jgi:hypothetical protein